MISKLKFAVLGGDTRQIAVANRFCEEGLRVHVFGLPQKELFPQIVHFSDWREAICGVDAVVLPLPASPDGKHLNQPLCNEQEAPLLADVFDLLAKDVKIFGGRFSPAVKSLAEERKKTVIDYFNSEDLQEKNALPTAEGAVAILMREIPRTVSGLSVGVTGYGRVAKALIRLLLAMGADVTVTARKQGDIERAAKQGCKTVLLDGKHALTRFAQQKAVIFNTVPYWLFSEDVLATMSQATQIIDLASAPGGVDANAADLHGIKVIWALSLPGKYAPVTAGELIADTVLSQLHKEDLL